MITSISESISKAAANAITVYLQKLIHSEQQFNKVQLDMLGNFGYYGLVLLGFAPLLLNLT